MQRQLLVQKAPLEACLGARQRSIWPLCYKMLRSLIMIIKLITDHGDIVGRYVQLCSRIASMGLQSQQRREGRLRCALRVLSARSQRRKLRENPASPGSRVQLLRILLSWIILRLVRMPEHTQLHRHRNSAKGNRTYSTHSALRA